MTVMLMILFLPILIPVSSPDISFVLAIRFILFTSPSSSISVDMFFFVLFAISVMRILRNEILAIAISLLVY